MSRPNCSEINHSHDENELLLEWWIKGTSREGKNKAKAVKSIHLLVTWKILCARNKRVFRNKEKTMLQLLTKIKNEIKLWSMCEYLLKFLC